MRVVPKPSKRGSQKWLQIAANEKQDALNAAICNGQIGLKGQPIAWVSPLKADEYAEYRDEEFLERLNIELKNRQLSSFWPRRGPQWDGLAKAADGTVLLVEAKAHLAEIQSPASQAREPSRTLIQKSFNEVKSFLGVEHSVNWSGLYYQYANRIAHLYLLRELNKIPACLVFLCFLNDKDMNGPSTEAEWDVAIRDIESLLGLPAKHKLSESIMHIYLDISVLQ